MPKTKKDNKYSKRYDESSLEKAVIAVKNGMPKKTASREFGIPRSTLQFRMSEKFSKKEHGPRPILSKEEETLLVEWIMESYRKGFPQRKENLQSSVKHFLEDNPRPNPFRNNLPGDAWYNSFLKRHPILAHRQSEPVTAASSAVSEYDIRKWFSTIESYLKEKDLFSVLQHSDRVFNSDETNFQLCPKNKNVLAPKGARNVYEVDVGQAKTNLTVLFTFSASGTTTPPMIIYPYKRLPSEIAASVPAGWGIGVSDNGWMKTEIFFEYLANIFYPYLVRQNIDFPVILFVDGHSTHLNYKISELCTKLKIVLICLYQNSTRILQPADVAAFKPLKSHWKKGVLEWRQQNPSLGLTKEKFAPILEKVIKQLKPQATIHGFRACGLFPWNPDALDYTKCLGRHKIQNPEPIDRFQNQTLLPYSKFVEIVGENKINIFETLVSDKERNDDFLGLYKIYQYFHSDLRFQEESINTDQQQTNKAAITFDQPLDEVLLTIDPENLPDNVLMQDNVEIIFEDFFEPTKQSESTAYTESVHLAEPIVHEEPTEYTEPSEFVESTELITVACIQSDNLSKYLQCPQTPSRKGKKNSQRSSFVITSSWFKRAEVEKREKKERDDREKAERKRKREEAKEAKESKAMQKTKVAKIKNKSNKEKITSASTGTTTPLQ